MQQVEKYKLTKDQVAWSKNYSKMLKIAKLLDTGMLHHMSKAKGFGMLLQQTEQQLQEMIQSAPKKPIHDLPEQQSLDEKYQGFNINY